MELRFPSLSVQNLPLLVRNPMLNPLLLVPKPLRPKYLAKGLARARLLQQKRVPVQAPAG
jgi:hypothetical protein